MIWHAYARNHQDLTVNIFTGEVHDRGPSDRRSPHTSTIVVGMAQHSAMENSVDLAEVGMCKQPDREFWDEWNLKQPLPKLEHS